MVAALLRVPGHLAARAQPLLQIQGNVSGIGLHLAVRGKRRDRKPITRARPERPLLIPLRVIGQILPWNMRPPQMLRDDLIRGRPRRPRG